MNLVINAQLHRTQQSASLILISRSASAPRGRAVWREGRAGRGAEEQRRPGPVRAEAGRTRLAGRRVRAGGSAAARRRDTAPLLGASSCSAAAAAASSSQAASAGRLLGLGQHCPAVSHTPLRRGVFYTRAHTPRPHAPLEKSKFRESERKGWRR